MHSKVIVGVFALASYGLAHDHWINHKELHDPITHQWCCNDNDCRAEEVVEKPEGVLVSNGELISWDRVIWDSPDGKWWRCHDMMAGNGVPLHDVTRCLIGPHTPVARR